MFRFNINKIRKFLLFLILVVTVKQSTLQSWLRLQKENGEMKIYRNQNIPFEWSFLDTSVPAVCGMNKCFFQDKDDPARGYLLVINYHHDKENNLSVGWERAKLLKQKYGTRHFSLSPPEKVLASDELSRFTNEIVKKSRNSSVHTLYSEVDTKQFKNKAAMNNIELTTIKMAIGNGEKPREFSVQKMNKAPDPFLEW